MSSTFVEGYSQTIDRPTKELIERFSMNTQSLQLLILDERIAVCQLSPDESLPGWAIEGPFFSITRTQDELSIVCPESVVPEDVKAVKDWRCFRVVGSMDFSVVGVLSALTAPLAEANIGIFALSTFDTDYLLVQEQDLDQAIEALLAWGHVLPGSGSTKY